MDTISLPLILGWDGSGTLVWSIDVSFAVHMDMKSHSGFSLSFGKGAVISGSCTQTSTAESSTEVELYWVYDAMPLVSWARLFFEAQVKGMLDRQNLDNENTPRKSLSYVTDLGLKNVILQDNTSVMKLEINGKRSSSKQTRHIAIRYFLITNKIKNGNIQVLN